MQFPSICLITSDTTPCFPGVQFPTQAKASVNDNNCYGSAQIMDLQIDQYADKLTLLSDPFEIFSFDFSYDALVNGDQKDVAGDDDDDEDDVDADVDTDVVADDDDCDDDDGDDDDDDHNRDDGHDDNEVHVVFHYRINERDGGATSV